MSKTRRGSATACGLRRRVDPAVTAGAAVVRRRRDYPFESTALKVNGRTNGAATKLHRRSIYWLVLIRVAFTCFNRLGRICCDFPVKSEKFIDFYFFWRRRTFGINGEGDGAFDARIAFCRRSATTVPSDRYGVARFVPRSQPQMVCRPRCAGSRLPGNQSQKASLIARNACPCDERPRTEPVWER